jgi:alpha-beta hydrolase superfamily lysophospholipase
MAEDSLQDWLREGEEALAIGAMLGEQVIVLGTSTGGTLATWLAAHDTQHRAAAVILLSPNFGMRAAGAGLLTWPGGVSLARVLIGPYRSFPAHSPAHARHWTTRYPVAALKPMAELVERVNGLDLRGVTQPVLMLYSVTDKVVRPDRTEQRFLAWGAKQKQLQAVVTHDPDAHVLAGDILSPGTTRSVADVILGFVHAIGLR